MGISLSGLISNMDTDTMVTQMVSGYKAKKDTYVKAQTKLEWKQDAWKDMNTKIYGFYSKYLTTLRFSGAYNKKTSSVSNNKATVTSSNNAVSGTQKLKINKLASAGYLTGGVVSTADGKKATIDTKLSNLGITDGSKMTMSVDGQGSTISVNGDSKVNDLLSQLKDAGGTDNFDEKNQRFFVASKVSGKDADFSLTSDNEAGVNALSKLGLTSVTSADIENYQKMANYTDTELGKIIQTAYTKQKQNYYDKTKTDEMTKMKDNMKSELDTLKKTDEDLAAKIKTLNYMNDAVATYDSEYQPMLPEEKTAYMENLTKQIEDLSKKENLSDAEKDTLNKLQAKKQVYTDLSTAGADKTIYQTNINKQITDNQKTLDDNTAKVSTYNTALASDADFDAYIDSLNDKITEDNDNLLNNLTSYYTTQRETAKAYATAYQYVNTSGVDKNGQDYKDAAALLGMGQAGGTGPSRISGVDSEITLNGATFTSNSNNYEINGLAITANQLTDDDEEISITTDIDTKGIYDMIKGFFSDYNTLINDMDAKYNAKSAKGYEPLTEDEKEAMTDKQIEKWEDKIKDALFRRDETLEGVGNALKTAFQKSYEIDGKSYSLASFGITTGSYFTTADNEKNAFHIDGDSDDTVSSKNKDKLMAAIASDPEKVTSFFTQLVSGVYTELDKKMKSTSLSSAYTVYNDKQMTKDYKEYSKTIKEWETKITKQEERYRKQFTAMETAMSKLQSQTSQLSGLLGS